MNKKLGKLVIWASNPRRWNRARPIMGMLNLNPLVNSQLFVFFSNTLFDLFY